MYPCEDNTMFNFVCIHPREESQPGSVEGKTNAYKNHKQLGKLTDEICNRLEHSSKQECTPSSIQGL